MKTRVATVPESRSNAGHIQQRTAQAKMIDAGDHGQVWVPDNMNLTPDVPVYGNTQNVGSNRLAYPAATSMEVLLTPNHPMGSAPGNAEANLFDALPTLKSYKLEANKAKYKNGSTLFIKGHLLNDNLGGEGSERNLFPITHQANMDHDNKVEEPIKKMVNKEGGAVHYRVAVNKQGTGNTDVYYDNSKSLYQQYVNASFTCDISEYRTNGNIINHQRVINSAWEGTDNSGINNLSLLDSGAHVAATNFDVSKVKIMPRARAREEWNKGLIHLSEAIAQETGSDVAEWLISSIHGFGPKSSDMLLSERSYETLDRYEKGTLTKAQNLVREHLKKSYQLYLSAFMFDENELPKFEEYNDELFLRTMIKRLEKSASSLESLIEKMQSSSVLIKTMGPEEIENPGEYQNKKIESASISLVLYSDKLEMRLEVHFQGEDMGEIIHTDITQESLNILHKMQLPANVNNIMATMPDVMEIMKWGLSA